MCAYRALVVDDEDAWRFCISQALAREEFLCETAADGNLALEMMGDAEYDVVVTDLRMPNKHGHALAQEMIGRPRPPVIVVLTGIAEPRLLRDLYSRGVDAVEFKPISPKMLAAKVRVLVERKLGDAGTDSSPTSDTLAAAEAGAASIGAAVDAGQPPVGAS